MGAKSTGLTRGKQQEAGYGKKAVACFLFIMKS